MKIVTTTSVFPPCYPADKALMRLKNIGFDCLDMAFDYCTGEKDFPFVTDGWEKWANDLRDLSEKNSIPYTHAHSCGDASSRDEAFIRCFKASNILGIKYLVIHPVWRKEDGKYYETDDEFVEVNTRLALPLLEYAEKYDVKILSENLLWGASVRPSAIDNLVSEVDSPYFGWCYDTGHANCFGITSDSLLDIKNVPMSLHIQDNHGNKGDEHLIPGDGSIDWKRFLENLKKIGYKGELVLEAHHQSLHTPEEKREELLSELLLRAVGLNNIYTSI